MSALRLARGFTGRDLVVKFDGCYHGHADSFLVAAGSGVLTQGIPGSPGVPAEIAGHTLSLPYNDLDAVRKSICAARPGHRRVIVEPVAGNMGVVAPRGRLSPGPARSLRPARQHPDLRRGHHRLPRGLGRGPGPLPRHPRPHLPGQDHRRRAARRGLRRPPGPHANWPPPGRSTRPARSPATRWPWPRGWPR